MFYVHSFCVFVFLFIMLIWCPTVDSQHLSKSDKRDGRLDDRHGLSPILYAVMSTSHVCRVTSRVTIPSSQSHRNFFRVESESSHDLVESSQSRVTKSVESFRVTSLPTRVNVESNEIKHCHYYFFFNIFSFFLFYEEKWNENFFFFKWNFVFVKHHVKCN